MVGAGFRYDVVTTPGRAQRPGQVLAGVVQWQNVSFPS